MGFHAFGDFTMTRAGFNALLPHEKTEMAMLLREYAEQNGAAYALDPEIAAHCGLRHSYSLKDAGDIPVPPDSRSAADIGRRLVEEDASAHSYPRTAGKVLVLIAAAGRSGLRANRAGIAVAVGAWAGTAGKALDSLKEGGLIRRAPGDRWIATGRGGDIAGIIGERFDR